MLVADPENGADVGRLADRLQAALAIPFHVDGHTLVVSASIGVAETHTAGGSRPSSSGRRRRPLVGQGARGRAQGGVRPGA